MTKENWIKWLQVRIPILKDKANELWISQALDGYKDDELIRFVEEKGRVSRKELVEVFVKENEELIGMAILEKNHGLQKEIGNKARAELGYSKTTWSMDIFNIIENAYTRTIMNE